MSETPEELRWWTVRRTWHVRAASVTDALQAARPGEHDDAVVFASPLADSVPKEKTLLTHEPPALKWSEVLGVDEPRLLGDVDE